MVIIFILTGGALRASRSLFWWAGQEAWTVAQLVRVTLYRCLRSMQVREWRLSPAALCIQDAVSIAALSSHDA